MLNLISLLSTFIVAQIVMMTIWNFFFGKLVFLNVIVTKGIALKHIIFFLLNTLLLLNYTTFYLPH
jgi:hypothetical protein